MTKVEVEHNQLGAPSFTERRDQIIQWSLITGQHKQLEKLQHCHINQISKVQNACKFLQEEVSLVSVIDLFL